MKKIFLLILLLSLFLFLTSALPDNVYAADKLDCSKLAGKPGPHAGAEGYTANPQAIYNGQHCDRPGESLDISCIGACKYVVTWCNDFGFPGEGCVETYPEESCSRAPAVCNKPDTVPQSDISKIFGNVKPPRSIENFGFGAAGISKFLSNFVNLIFMFAMIVFVFMILFSAFEWMTSGGDKEKVAAARQRIINALIGIVLLAVAFAIFNILGQFTGFSFFKTY